MSQEPQVRFEIRVPEPLEGGVYANFLSVWNTPHEFTLDFAATLPPEPTEDEGLVNLPCRVTARVKMSPSLIFNVLRALNENMTMYEANYGPIQRPGEEAEMTLPPDFGEGEHQ